MTCYIDGIKINYELCGEGKCVLFLHGWGANLKLFDYLADTVAKKYTALRLDLPGFGESAEPESAWSVDDYVAFVRKFTKELGLEPQVLIGHSFGGRLMIKMLSDGENGSVEKAVFIDAAGIKPKKTLRQKLSLGMYKAGKRILSRRSKSCFPRRLKSSAQSEAPPTTRVRRRLCVRRLLRL